jgi:hypothetical protein
MTFDLFITGNGVPVCEAHLEKYIHSPSFLAVQCDYDAWFHSHGKAMSCARCIGVTDDGSRSEVDVVFPETNSAEERRGIASSGTLDEEVFRHFREYISHASYAE